MSIVTAVINNEWFAPVFVMTIVFCCIAFSFTLRGRAMRAVAAEWGLNYIGPSKPKLVFGYMPKIKPHLPFSRAWYPANIIRQAWNVMEGQVGGLPVVVFDSLLWQLGSWGGGQYCTFVACQSESSPFEAPTSGIADRLRDSVVHEHGWTILYQVPLVLKNPFTTFSMSRGRLEFHLKNVQQSMLDVAVKSEAADPL